MQAAAVSSSVASSSTERKVLNGRTIPLEDYGSIRDEDRMRILDDDELVSVNRSHVTLFFVSRSLDHRRNGIHVRSTSHDT